jgi:hypothetical protein
MIMMKMTTMTTAIQFSSVQAKPSPSRRRLDLNSPRLPPPKRSSLLAVLLLSFATAFSSSVVSARVPLSVEGRLEELNNQVVMIVNTPKTGTGTIQLSITKSLGCGRNVGKPTPVPKCVWCKVTPIPNP